MSESTDTVRAIANEHISLFQEGEPPGPHARIAQLERELAEQKSMNDAMNALALSAGSTTGQEFLQKLVRQLSAALKVQYVFVTEWVPGRTDRLRTVAGWHGDRAADPIEYDLPDTPCRKVLQDGEAFIPRGVRQLFPQDEYLTALGVESYTGVSLLNSAGRPTGHLCIMDVRPFLFDGNLGIAILRAFANRAAAELERLRAEETLRQREERFRTLYDDNPSMYFTLSPAGTVLSVNRFGSAQLGYTSDELVGQSVLNVFDPINHQTVLEQLVLCASHPHETFEWELQKVRKDQTRLWVRERARAVSDTQGTLTILVVCEDVTEPRRATRLLETLVRESPLPIVSLDPDARVTSWNQAATQLFGWSEKEVLGRELPYIQSGEEAAADALWEAGTRGQVVGPIELRRERKDGTMLDLLLWPVFVHDDSERLSTAICLYVDRSEVKQAEAAQRKSEVRLRSFLDALDDLAFEFDGDGTFLNVWTRNEATLLLPKPDIVGKRLSGVFGQEEGARYLLSIGRVLATGQSESVEYSLTLRGQVRHFSAVMSQIPVVGDTLSTVACVVREITEQKRTEMALRESTARLDRFVADAPVGLVILDKDKRVISANKAFCELTGYPESEMLGNTYALYTHPDDLPANLILTDEFYRGARSEYTYEKRYIRKSGEIIWVSVKATGVELPGHPGPLLLAAVQDITERKLATEEREQLSRDLHDNLLQSIYAVGMQLEAGKLAMGKSLRKSKSHMIQAIDQLNHLILDVRQFITLLKQRSAAKLDFGQALRQLVVSLSATGPAAPELEIKDHVLSFITPAQGEQLLNIAREALSNSTRHAQATHRSVRLSHTGNSIRLAIWDDGIGFASERRRHRGHGLANMAARAKKILARFTLASAPGKGTCVTVEVPIEKETVHA
ncbi:MAG: PAS domain S-box protein [Nitrospirae bacterium]|nr:PAS domain S-box protein [Nitrospirota bacterium]